MAINSAGDELMQQSLLRLSVVVALSTVGQMAMAQPAPAPIEESSSGTEKLGYKTVAAALEGLRGTPGVVITTTQPDGWTVAVEPITKAVWSFTPPGHYAYPAVVRRQVKQRDGGVYVEMVALCQAEKVPCDNLIREFQGLNQKISESMRNRQPGQGQK